MTKRTILSAGFVVVSALSFSEERIDTALLGDRGVAWVGPVDVSPAIHTIGGVGDVDGDGLDDFAIGFLERPFEETPVPWAVFLVYGRPRLSGDVPLVPWLDRTWQVRGREPTGNPQSHVVLHIASAGDVDGDRYGDFFLGYGVYPDWNPGDGTAVLVHGGPDLEGETTLEDLLDSDGVTVFRSSAPRYQQVGARCHSIGDFNGDGEADIAIDAPFSRLDSVLEGEELGATFLVYGVRDLPRDVDVADVGTIVPGTRIEGFVRFWEETGDFRGTYLSGTTPLGDVNGDGLSDVAITADGPHPNRIFVVLGSRESPPILPLSEAAANPSVIEIRGPVGAAFNVIFGGTERIAGLGDVNGDGLADFAVSQTAWCCPIIAPARESWVQVFFGSATFPKKVELAYDEVDPSLGVRIEAAQRDARFGSQIASAGDFDGDGRPDLLIGSTAADPGGPSVDDRGEAYVLSSREGFAEPSVLTGPFPGVRVIGKGSREHLGYPVASAGDFDGDGFDDVLVVSRRSVFTAEREEHPGQPRAYLIYGGPAEVPFTLADVRPAFGPTSGGKVVRLVGSGFTPDVRVFFGDVEATGVEVESSSYLDVVIPPGRRGLFDVRVTLGAETRTLAASFFYSPILPLDLAELGERGFTVRGPIGLGLGNGIAVDDFDGDGFDDVLASACWIPSDEPGEELDGCFAVLVRGRRDPEDTAVLDPSESTTTFLFPDPVRTMLIASPGDVDGDGIADMFFAFDGGYGYIVFGRPGWPTRVELAALFEAGKVVEVVSPAPGRMPIAGLGDVDGDGLDDFAVAILPDPLAGQQGIDPQGEVVFVAGRRSWESLFELPAQASGRIRAGLQTNELGREVAAVGDVNGDGLGDLLASSERGPEQSAYLIYGHRALLDGGVEELSLLVADSERARSFVGISPPGLNYPSHAFSGAGDVNGDGFADVLIGLPQAGGLFRGRSYLILGAATLENLVLKDRVAPPPGVTGILGDGSTYANAGVARCGDLDGDGLDDFVVKAPTGFPPNPGYMYILSGTETYPPEIVLGRSGLESIRLDSGFPLSSVREVADSVGDFNGDGADDFVVREGGHVDVVAGQPATGDRISVIFGLPRNVAFVRGDTNQDVTVNLADPVFLLQHLFAGREQPPCMKAADTNDDGGVDLADAVFLLNSLFAGGAALPEPHGVCGFDPTSDSLSCEASPVCSQ